MKRKEYLSFKDFLKDVVSRHQPEALMMLGSVDASPESGQPKLHPQSYAIELFPSTKIIDSREFDRAALGLQAFYQALTQEGLNDWSIAEDLRFRISTWTQGLVKTQFDLEAWSYAILFNDLGKLHISNHHHQKLFGVHASDHDANMANILEKDPAFYVTFQNLAKQYQTSLVKGLKSGFNLGKAVQLECPDNAWQTFLKLSVFDQNFHLGHSLFDFFGVSGASNPREFASFVMNDKTVSAFLDTVELHNPIEYGKKRLLMAGLNDIELHTHGFARLVSMARIFDTKTGSKLLKGVQSLSKEYQTILLEELENPGTPTYPAIELQYAPALLNQAINDKNETVLKKTLMAMVDLLIDARDLLKTDLFEKYRLNPIYILNMVNLVNEFKLKGINSLKEVSQGSLIPMSGGWRWSKIKHMHFNQLSESYKNQLK